MKTLNHLLFTLTSISISFTSVINAQTGNAVFNFISQDPAGEGFDDQTPRSEIDPVIIGDNPGTTLGELRKNVLVEAGNRWGHVLLSNVPIDVEVDYQDFGGSESGSIVLASAGAATLSRNFNNAPLADTFYPIALANSLAGTDLSSAADIVVSANSNSELSDSQEGNFTWYYGLDNNAPNGTIDFLTVMSHELGHGLGFFSTVISTSGNFLNDNPDVYSRNIYDTAQGLAWDQMTSAQRLISTESDPNLTWDGPYVTGAINGIDSFVSQGINTADSSSTSYAAEQASFGGSISTQGFSGNLVLVNDGTDITADLAQEIQNGAAVSGNIALIERGLVNFDLKVRRAQDAGATAAIIYNNIANANLISPTAAGQGVIEPTIPILFVSLETGNDLRDLLTDELSVTIFTGSVIINSDDDSEPVLDRRLRLHAPSSFASGSSISHWSTNASPNLLMEPSINSDISDDLDLSVLLMKDIGWQTTNISIPHLTYDSWLTDTGFGTETENTTQLDDFDNDNISNLEEYYHGIDPRSPNGTQLRLINEQIIHQRSRLVNDINVTYQRGSLINDLNSFSITETIENIDSSIEEARIDINTSSGREFFRLSLEALEPDQ